MSFNSGYNYLEIHSRHRPCCNCECEGITTEMKIHYKINQISPDQSILPTLFELYDDNILRLVWKLRFLVPAKLGMLPLSNLLDKFAKLAIATDSTLQMIGVKDLSGIFRNSVNDNSGPSLLPTDLEKLGCEFNMMGIYILDEETIKIPEGQYENPPNVKLDWSILHHFFWTTWEIKKEKLKYKQLSNSSSSDESSKEAAPRARRGVDTCGNYSFH